MFLGSQGYTVTCFLKMFKEKQNTNIELLMYIFYCAAPWFFFGFVLWDNVQGVLESHGRPGWIKTLRDLPFFSAS